ncbi:hypothetical protein LZG04_35620 [Saccharothrix sp. S26]|uniref:hypothetical protein n=1 Tax=Saccharothrix sp. S26 TaxID=2907215 RepID=UPI001F383F08|nr:hypothetical protein [Saccharothrix sp. S26]MCE7000108.1 hypothetical protein [Saccharothrix sp. S26]
MTSVPPSRRRPVPTPPTTRPRVAGLRKRTDPPPTPVEDTRAAGGARPENDPATSRDERPAPATEPTGSPADGLATDPTADAAVAGQTAARPGAGTHAEPATDTSVGGRTTGRRAAEPAHLDSDTLPSDRDITRSTEVTGLIEPREDTEPEDETPDTRPRPTGRRKRTGEAVAAGVLADPQPEHAKSEADDWADRHTDDRTGPGLVLPIALVVLAALLVGLGAWFQSRAGQVAYNEALVDSAGTTEVAGQAREAVEKAFSYNYADVSTTEKAANELLVGKAKCQYNAIFGPVRTLAPEQKLVVTVKAVSSGVTALDGDRATVLLFLDQVTTRTTDNQSGGGIAMMRVGAQRVDGRWKVDNMEMFGQTGDQAAETAKC